MSIISHRQLATTPALRYLDEYRNEILVMKVLWGRFSKSSINTCLHA